MKKEKNNIFVAFILNFTFAIFEIVGGILTGSVAIASDALHDLGDSASIGICAFLEKKSKRKPSEKYNYGYARFSVLGSFLTAVILLLGSGIVIYNAIIKLINPTPINHDGMILFAIVGVVVNFVASIYAGRGNSLNGRLVSLHMLEDVLTWIVVLVGGVVIKFTNFVLIDPILSIIVALYIIYNALKGLSKIVDLFILKTPQGITLEDIKKDIKGIDGVGGVYHLHVWSLDGINNVATLHAEIEGNAQLIKRSIRKELLKHSIVHATIEICEGKEDLVGCEIGDLEKTHVNAHSHHHHAHHHHAHTHGHCH